MRSDAVLRIENLMSLPDWIQSGRTARGSGAIGLALLGHTFERSESLEPLKICHEAPIRRAKDHWKEAEKP